jgi:hypothetical protein
MRSGTCFEHEVERRLRRLPESGEAGLGHDPAQRLLTGLGAEGVGCSLRERVRHAVQDARPG